jgi:hypothetical protein
MAKKNGSEMVKQDTEKSTGLERGVDAAALIRELGYSLTRDLSMEKGDVVRGFFVGAGSVVSLPSKQRPGEFDDLRTWRVRSPDGSIEWRIMGSQGLDKHLEPLAPETPVVIAHLGTIETKKGNRMNDFAVAVGKPAGA